jgi:hypothetical protein
LKVTVRWCDWRAWAVVGVRVSCREVFGVACEEGTFVLLVCVWGSCNRGSAAAVAQMLRMWFSVVLELSSLSFAFGLVCFVPCKAWNHKDIPDSSWF